ncbi:MAG TPA: DHA2 family efflux MFS transporter permease subunit [Candidatus Dormibacteraeota bacterium]|nr:DHA2 family efflux MFS transporter permease subunit [Candidatus Dormibacteraeota bacterium]
MRPEVVPRLGQPLASAPRVGMPSSATRGLEYKWIAAGVVLVGAIMAILDQTVVNVALPTLEKDFATSLTDIQWVVTAYALALAAVIPTSGWLTDRFGSKWVFFTSQALFTVGSALCGLAWSDTALIGFRILQGLGGGLIMPVGMATVMRVTRPDERGRLMAVLGFPMLVAPVLGPTLGGWLVQSVSWRLIFYINLPIGIVGCLMTAFFLRDQREPHAERERLDLLGFLLVTPAVVGLVYGLSQAGTYGWESVQTVAPLIAGAVLLAAFCLYEVRQPAPLIDIRVFRDAAFSASIGLNFLIGLALFGAIFLLPLFLQQVQGYGAFDAGLILAAQGVSAGIVMPVSGMLTDRFGAARVVPFGLALLAAGTLWLTTIAPGTSSRELVAMLAVRGAGMGFTMMPIMSAAYVTLRPAQIARATSVSNVVQRVASALGVAVMATVLSNRITANLPPLPAGVSAASGGGIASAHLSAPLQHYLLTQVARGFDDAFWVALGLSMLCFPMALLLRRAMRPGEVRAYALKRLAEGIVLVLAVRRLRAGGLDRLGLHLDPAAVRSISAAAAARLEDAVVLLRAGTAAAGLVPQPRLSLPRRVGVGVTLVAAVVCMALAIGHGYQAPQVPPPPAIQHQQSMSPAG